MSFVSLVSIYGYSTNGKQGNCMPVLYAGSAFPLHGSSSLAPNLAARPRLHDGMSPSAPYDWQARFECGEWACHSKASPWTSAGTFFLRTKVSFFHPYFLLRRLPKLRAFIASISGSGCGLWKEILWSRTLNVTADPALCVAAIPASANACTKWAQRTMPVSRASTGNS
jgi:hypothetical protein